MSPPSPLCFVLMPFGTKATQGGGSIDFDKIYRDAIAPAIQDADLVPIRADEERTGGIIHKPMFERLLLGEWRPPALAQEKTDVFREHVRHNEGLKGRMADARAKAEAGEHAGALADLRAVEADVGSLDRGEVGVIVDLMLSYRAIEAWSD